MKKIKSESAVKSNTPYRMKFIKKVATIASAVVLSAALFLGAAFTLTGCNNGKDPIDPNPPITQPDDPDKPGEPTDPEKPGDPTDPENPGDPTDPENPGDPENPSDPTDPEKPGEEIPWTPLEPAVKPVDSLEDLYVEAPDATDTEKYPNGEEDLGYITDNNQYETAQAMQKAIYQNLEANVKDIIGYKTVGSDYNKANTTNTKWELASSQNNNVIDSIRMFFTYKKSDTNNYYYITSVTPSAEVTLESLADGTLDYEAAFDTSRNGAKFNREYQFSYDPAASEQRKELLDAINNKVVGEVSEDTISIIKPLGGSTDNELGGTANSYEILNISENGYKDYKIKILDESNGKSEIENLNNGKFYTYEEKSEEYGNQFLDASVLENEITQQQNKNVKYVAKVSLPKEDGTFEEFEIEL